MAEHSVREDYCFDLEIEVVHVDPDSGHIEFHVHPDPGRYDWLERNGERVLYDRFDDYYFPHALVMDMLKRAMSMPRGPGLAVIPNVEAYVTSRRPVIAATLRGEAQAGELVDIAEAQLREFEKDELAFVILSLDIKGLDAVADELQPADLREDDQYHTDGGRRARRPLPRPCPQVHR
jgi:hypothetical protein